MSYREDFKIAKILGLGIPETQDLRIQRISEDKWLILLEIRYPKNEGIVYPQELWFLFRTLEKIEFRAFIPMRFSPPRDTRIFYAEIFSKMAEIDFSYGGGGPKFHSLKLIAKGLGFLIDDMEKEETKRK